MLNQKKETDKMIKSQQLGQSMFNSHLVVHSYTYSLPFLTNAAHVLIKLSQRIWAASSLFPTEPLKGHGDG